MASQIVFVSLPEADVFREAAIIAERFNASESEDDIFDLDIIKHTKTPGELRLM